MSELPSGWLNVALGDLCVAVTGTTKPESGTTYELYSVPALPSGEPETVCGSAIRSAKRPVAPGDVLLCKINPRINRVWIVGNENGNRQLASTEFIPLRLPQGMATTARYLMWYLRSPRFRSWIKLNAEGATGSHTRAKGPQVLRQLIPVAPLDEQRRIVASIEEQFSRLDMAETALHSALHRLEALRSNAVAAAYYGDWPWTTLGEIAEIVGGVTKDSKRESDPSFVTMPYLRVANVQRGYLDLSEVATIRVSPDKAHALLLQPGDVLFNEGGDRDKLGRGWVWSGEIDRCIHQNHVFRARLSKRFDPRFVSWHGNTFGQRWFDTHGRQTTNLASLNLTTLKSFPVPAPPFADQLQAVEAIDRQLSIVDATTKAVNGALVQGQVLRRAILECAFSGKLVSQGANDEPASVLLERVMAERSSSNGQKPTKPRSPRRRMATA